MPVKPPGVIAGISIFIALQSIVAMAIVWINIFEEVEPGHQMAIEDIVLLCIYALFGVVCAIGLWKGVNWVRHLFIDGLWLLLVFFGVTKYTNAEHAIFNSLTPALLLFLLSAYFYRNERAKSHFNQIA